MQASPGAAGLAALVLFVSSPLLSSAASVSTTLAAPPSIVVQQAAATGPQWVSAVGDTATYSTLDNPKDPTSGIRVQTSNELAGLGGAARFAKTTEDVRYYHPIVGDIVGTENMHQKLYQVAVSQPLYNGGQTIAKTGQADHLFAAQQWSLTSTEQNVMLAVAGGRTQEFFAKNVG